MPYIVEALVTDSNLKFPNSSFSEFEYTTFDFIFTVSAVAYKFPDIIPPLLLESILSVPTEAKTLPSIVFLISYWFSTTYKSEYIEDS